MATKSEPRNTTEIQNKGTSPVAGTEEIKTEMDGIKSKLEELDSAFKGTPYAAEIKDLVAGVDAIKAAAADSEANHATLVKALTDRVDELQTGNALAGVNQANQPEGLKAITAAVMESDGYKAIHDENGLKASQLCAPGTFTGKVQIPSFTAQGFKAASPVPISAMAGGNLTAYRPGIFQDQRWQMDVASRIPKVTVKNATAYAIPRETLTSKYGAWTTTLTANIDGDPTPKSVASFTDVDGLMIGSICRFYNASGVVLGSAAVVSIATLDVTFTTNSLDFDATSGWRVTSENYGVTAELGTKPSGWLATENVSFSLKMLATILPTTVNALNTIMGMSAFIEQKLPMEAQRNLSRHVLYGDDGAGQLQGLRSYSGAQSYDWSDGVSGDNQLDAIMRATNLIPWTAPISVIMSQADMTPLQLLKGSDGHYLRTGNFGMVPLTNVGFQWFLGAFELVFDYAVTSGDFTVINFGMASEIADQETANLLWGYVDNDFETNVIRARYEQTLAHAIKSVQSYVVGEWDAAP